MERKKVELTIDIDNMEEYLELVNEVKQKTEELTEAVQRLNGFKLSIEATAQELKDVNVFVDGQEINRHFGANRDISQEAQE